MKSIPMNEGSYWTFSGPFALVQKADGNFKLVIRECSYWSSSSTCSGRIDDPYAADRELLLQQIVRDVRALRELELGDVADDGTPGRAFYVERLKRNREALMRMTGGTNVIG